MTGFVNRDVMDNDRMATKKAMSAVCFLKNKMARRLTSQQGVPALMALSQVEIDFVRGR